MNVLDLFSGIGGFSLGLERAGMRTVAFCEIDPFCQAVLRKHWPNIPCYREIKLLPKIKADVVCGGFPCQPFSTASHGLRIAEDLWPDMFRTIVAIRPRYVIAENVQEQAIAYATQCLSRLGYGTYYRCISGIDCGADHQRDRWWAIAYPHSQSKFRSTFDAEVAKLPALCAGLWGAENYTRAIRVSDGISNRMDSPAPVGNAIFPQIPEIIGRAIMQAEASALTSAIRTGEP